MNKGGDGEGAEIITRAAWNAMTTARKQAKGLVAIQDTNTGYQRGVFVNGADYVQPNIYIPNSDETKVLCEAYYNNFDVTASTWGAGISPAQYLSSAKPSANSAENAIYVPAAANGVVPYVDLGDVNTPFTAYVVMKLVNPSTYSRIVSCMSERSTSLGIMLYGPTVNISSWSNDTSTGISSTDYFVGCIRYGSTTSGFAYDGTDIVSVDKNPTSCGRYVTLARTDINSSTSNAEPSNCYVRYFAVVGEAESDSIIEANINALYQSFIGGAVI